MRRLIFKVNEWVQKGNTWALLEELHKNESLPRQKIKEIQWEKLSRLIRYAYENVPFYRNVWKKRGLVPRDIRHFDDFKEKMPIISKKDVRDHFDEFVSEHPLPGVYVVETSGTTGYPVIFLRDGVARSYTMAGRFRGRGWWDVSPIDTEVRFWGRTSQFTPSLKIKVHDKIKRFKDLTIGIHYCSSFQMSEKDLEKYRRVIQRTDPKIIFGFPSAMFIFSKYMKDRGFNFLDSNIQLITYTAEPFYGSQKKVVQEVLGTSIGAEYGSVENGVMAFECPEGSFHVMDEDILMESSPVNEERSQLIATNLNLVSFPLIRYTTEDVGTLSDKMCRCGRPLTVMTLGQGRMFDYFRKPDGTYIVAAHIDDAIYLPLMDVEGCRRYRAIQRALNRVEVLLETRTILPKNIVDRIHQNLVHLMGKGVDIDIRQVDQLSVEKSGKFKCIISDLPLPE